ncbi:MAG: hypothetical protein HOP10_11665 [Chitinophagaceae bacterium]|nr:hypothetical protein [Chitinophagaceae bacterium]
MANQPIPVNKATLMMQDYVSYMTGLGVNMNQQTQTISFNADDLRQWIDGVMPFTDEFRLCLGVYPPADANAGRITVAIWPYKNGQPATDTAGRGTEIEPFNEGQGHP